MNKIEARLIEVRLEAAFDRYNRAAMSGIEPTLELFVEALQAEGLALSLATHAPGVPTTTAADTSAKPALTHSAPLGRRLEGILARRARGLP